jgi:uncharacterized membrane protein YczE
VENQVKFLLKMPSLLLGLSLFAAGVVANLYSGLGMMPWGVLNVGVARLTPLTLGQASQLIGFIVLVLGWGLGFPPGLGTIANMYFVGLFIDLIMQNDIIPRPTRLPGQLGLLLLSVILIGVGSLFYLRVELGAGPRDGLMMGLVKKLDRPVAQIRASIEFSVIVLGYLLGGPVGVGTLITALTVGYSVQYAFRLGGFDPKNADQLDLFGLWGFLKGRKE